jgi:hypothetical protein
MICKCTINTITNQNPDYSQTPSCDNMKLDNVSVVKFPLGNTESHFKKCKSLFICEYDTFVAASVINKKLIKTHKVTVKLCLCLTNQALYHEDILDLGTR